MTHDDDFAEWEREAAEDAAEAARIDAVERAHEAHLLLGEWIDAGDALTFLIRRGSSATSAALSLFNWLLNNDGQRPLLRARATQIRRMFPREKNPLSIWNDRAVFSFDWASEVHSIDWGGGTFVLVEPAEGDQHLGFTTTLTGVRFSLDDLNRLVAGKGLCLAVDPRPFDLVQFKQMLSQANGLSGKTGNDDIAMADAPSEDDPLPREEKRPRGRPKSQGFRDEDVPAFGFMQSLIDQGRPIATAAREAERRFHAKSSSIHWDRLRKAYPKWSDGMDNK